MIFGFEVFVEAAVCQARESHQIRQSHSADATPADLRRPEFDNALPRCRRILFRLSHGSGPWGADIRLDYHDNPNELHVGRHSFGSACGGIG
jgi:hypothetical protein